MMKKPALASVATNTFDRSRTRRHGRFATTIRPTDRSSSAVSERASACSSRSPMSHLATRLAGVYAPASGQHQSRPQSRRPGCRFGRKALLVGGPRNSHRRADSSSLKRTGVGADSSSVDGRPLPTTAGPVPDRLSIWPLDDGTYGLDATFQGVSGYDRADWHTDALREAGVEYSFRQELGDAWTIRFGPLSAAEVSKALTAFVQ